MKKMILAISIEAPATAPKPKIPAINAMIRNGTTQPSMTRTSDFHALFDLRATAAAPHGPEEKYGVGTNVPGHSPRQVCDKSRSSKEQNRGWMPKPEAADHRIKPVKSAPKTLYALQSCYEASPSLPRGAIVGGRRFADGRAEQTDQSRRS